MNDDKNRTATTTPIAKNGSHGSLWQPVVGEETNRVVAKNKLPNNGEDIIASSTSILSRCVNPDNVNNKSTGLVVGYVQSGKTLSFTTVMALARDNGFRLIILIAGISKALLEQSTQRLRNDLSTDEVSLGSRWQMITNPSNSNSNRRSINEALKDWDDQELEKCEQRTVLITVMKNYRHLNKLIALFRNVTLNDIPTLIIDDEADQASLNIQVSKGGESTTYHRLLTVREFFNCHTYLQYTATPQAPLLINIVDSLSPDFVEVLEPGESYIGGKDIFTKRKDLVKLIPSEDVLSADNKFDHPPSSLLDALRIFLLGVAAGFREGRSQANTNRSMLVHPSREKETQKSYFKWINYIFDEWMRIINLDETDPDRINFIDECQVSYDELAKTEHSIPKFGDIIQAMPRVFGRINIEEVNTRTKNVIPTIDWTRNYGWILIGGQAMDRGFTVEGLTVTYMPRGAGVGNADTIQQRARFFGYKRSYLGYCRTYLAEDVLSAFQMYVEHEEEMRKELQNVKKKSTPLNRWKRAFVLSPDLSPCRSNVIDYMYKRGAYSDDWFSPRFVFGGESLCNDNRIIVQSFFDKFSFAPNRGDKERSLAQKHHVCHNVPLSTAVEELLIPYRLTEQHDTQNITGVLMQLSRALDDNSMEKCTVYRMSPDFDRARTIDDHGEVLNIFQGAFPVNPKKDRGKIYPGDREIHEATDVTIQVHIIDLKHKDKDKVIFEKVPVIVAWIPSRMSLPWITQEQP